MPLLPQHHRRETEVGNFDISVFVIEDIGEFQVKVENRLLREREKERESLKREPKEISNDNKEEATSPPLPHMSNVSYIERMQPDEPPADVVDDFQTRHWVQLTDVLIE
jgi:hypothetical protein